jgi:hypothetical protein
MIAMRRRRRLTTFAGRLAPLLCWVAGIAARARKPLGRVGNGLWRLCQCRRRLQCARLGLYDRRIHCGGRLPHHRPVGRLTVGPTAALQYTYVNIDSFSEHGSLAPLDIHSQSAESLRSDFGLRASYQWQLGNVLVEPSLRADWEHEYKYSDLPITAGFAGIPGPSDTFYGPTEGHDSAIVSAGVSVQWTPMIATYVGYR